MRSETGVFLTAEWRILAMLNYEIDPALLRPLTPAGTELDTWDGRCFASVVGFRFLKTRVLSVPIPFHRDFDEVNLRFYVRHKAADGWRRGVVFVKELVPRWAIAFVARTVYNERYRSLPIRHSLRLPDGDSTGSVRYQWRHRGRWNGLRLEIAGEPAFVPEDSEEAFITEHYWGYARQRNGSTLEYRVEHPRWRVWQGASPELECDVEALYGAPYAEALSSPPSSAFVADGSEVTVRKGMRV